MRVTSHTRRVSFIIAITVAAVVAVPSFASAITRSEIIARGLVWTDLRIPYSQSRYCTAGGSMLTGSNAYLYGYRTDCSGFASMTLRLKTSAGRPLSLDTAGLPNRLRMITKSKLVPGDLIVRPKTLKIDGKTVPYGHAVVFGGWTDSTKTYYWGLHESSSRGGAVRTKLRYGVSGFGDEVGFAPYRYPGVRERVRTSGIFLP